VSQPSIVNRVRELRQMSAGMTQEELARQCSVTRQTIIAMETGRYSPSLELAFKLARVFGVGIEDVFQWAPYGRSGRK
jgi:putative transcriptional regulator